MARPIGILYPGHSAEDDYAELEARLGHRAGRHQAEGLDLVTQVQDVHRTHAPTGRNRSFELVGRPHARGQALASLERAVGVQINEHPPSPASTAPTSNPIPAESAPPPPVENGSPFRSKEPASEDPKTEPDQTTNQ